MIGSERESFPSSASIRTATAVNCFVIDPSRKTESGASGTPSSRFAIP